VNLVQATIVVREYDQAIAFYTKTLGFALVEDTALGGGKRWVRVRARGTTLLLARAADEEQAKAIGRQSGGRVAFFIETDDFARDHAALVARGVRFVREPRDESYGRVAVFEDLYGNRFDLIQSTGVRALVETLGLAPVAPVDARVRQISPGVMRVEYLGDEDDPIAANLFVPEGQGPFPAALVYHQHNGEWHLGKSEVSGFAGSATQAFGPALAKRGVAVFAPDVLTFEERRKSGRGTEPHPRDWYEHYNELAYRLVRGDLVMRKHLSDGMRALTVLSEQPGIDRARIGVIGHSMGGTLALYHAAVDDRVAFGCASGAVSEVASRMRRGVGISMAEIVPGVRWTTRDVLAAAARKPFFVVSSSDDPYSCDAPDVVQGLSAEHLHVEGGHALDAPGFEAIVAFVSKAAGAVPLRDRR
jgi:dienelactone hydrolase/predicted enzyme related to lactoylglutathione lyase